MPPYHRCEGHGADQQRKTSETQQGNVNSQIDLTIFSSRSRLTPSASPRSRSRRRCPATRPRPVSRPRARHFSDNLARNGTVRATHPSTTGEVIRRDRAQRQQGVVVLFVKHQAKGVVPVLGRGRVRVDEPGRRAGDLRFSRALT